MHDNLCCTANKYAAMQQRGKKMIVKFIKKMAKEIIRQKRSKQTFRELDRLSDRELNDMGITRYDIAHIARNSIANR